MNFFQVSKEMKIIKGNPNLSVGILKFNNSNKNTEKKYQKN